MLLLFFNLIPIFPLDGEKILTYFMPDSAQPVMANLRRYGPFLLFLLIIAGRFGFDLLNTLIRVPAETLTRALIS